MLSGTEQLDKKATWYKNKTFLAQNLNDITVLYYAQYSELLQ